jgi:7,8-dihydroneopterin aldolase/epimerase/oxygenase
MTEAIVRELVSMAAGTAPGSLADTPMDIIFVRDVRVETLIGAYEHERRSPQMLHLNIEIGRRRLAACKTDRLADTIDYAAVVAAVRELFASHRFHLLEPLADSLASLFLQRFDAQWVRLDLAKNGVVEGAGEVGVQIERTR